MFFHVSLTPVAFSGFELLLAALMGCGASQRTDRVDSSFAPAKVEPKVEKAGPTWIQKEKRTAGFASLQ